MISHLESWQWNKMHIKCLQLKRFKQFTDTTINFKEGLSLVVGGNNSGKSTILQALAAWQFCKTLLEIEKGRQSWVAGQKNQGIGMGIVDFTPMHLPSLAHLWTNLKSQKKDEPDGYTLKIKVVWDKPDGEERYLEIGLSLANDRLFIKTTESSIQLEEVEDADGIAIDSNVPQIAYLPPFAGVTDRETRLTPAMRGRLIGQGLSGGVIRNALFDLHEINKRERSRLREGRPKIKNSDLDFLRKNDPWEILQRTMQTIFATELRVVPFNERYHSYLKVESFKGKMTDGVFKRHANYNSRDLMVEGSGFLQWLSVYALALSPEFNVVLLDEPDAHLHMLLQQQLTNELDSVSRLMQKQVLLATHSTELIRAYDYDKVLALRDRKGKYLAEDSDKIGILAGVGAIHTPKLHALIRHKRMLIVEGPSDERFLKLLASRVGIEWPKNLVTWAWPGKASERKQLFMQLKQDIPELHAISIRDRDEESDGTVHASLIDRSNDAVTPGFIALKWRRRHIENYLLCTPAIARTANISEDIVTLFLKEKHGLALPDDTTPSDILMSIRDARGKEIMIQGATSFREAHKITRDDVAKAMEKEEVPQDIITFLTAVTKMCN
ncbi:AAA family ATPase [Pseudomonas sp. SG20052]|uniref:ATP-dependent nuclease n=1 Tax=Pseudomonas sp. SG20052 TaxID=3074147 RepID=UPI00287F45B4|nr:AAA family ATPase [Pseudomonas sp. SG20052]WNF56041.1 AAA family ATPase [Pseudomonas sp. SG20052]